jgi:hypothetical protein
MLLNAEQRRVDSTLVGSSTKFKIEASAKAFGILSKNLYSDPISAFIREPICNGKDSHDRAGVPDRPMKVHLPTKFDCEFRVRDYGVSISYEGIHTLYATYFASDKNHSNDEIGGLGLGSKSPMAYTDQFTVKTYKNGLRNVYQVFIGKDGTPEVTDVMLNVPTDEEDGFEVIIPIKPSDIDEVQSRYFEFAQFMPVKPESNVTPENSSTSFTRIPDVMTSFELPTRPGWEIDLLQPDRYYSWRGYPTTIVMGIVPYTLSETQIKALPDAITRNVILRCPIGSFEVSPSRETLSLNVKDYDVLNTLFKELKPRLLNIARKAVAECTNAFDAARVYTNLRTSAMFNNLLQGQGPTVTRPPKIPWNGYILPDDLIDGHANIAVDVPLPGGLKVMTFNNKPISGKPVRMVNTTDSFPVGDAMYGDVQKPNVVYWSDRKRAYRHALPDNTPRSYNLWLLFGGTREQAVRFAGMYGLTVADLPKAPSKPRVVATNDLGDPVLPSSFQYDAWPLHYRVTAAELAEKSFALMNGPAETVWEFNASQWDIDAFKWYLHDGMELPCLATIPLAHKKVRAQLEELVSWESWEEFVDECIDLDKVLAYELQGYRYRLYDNLKFPKALNEILRAYDYHIRRNDMTQLPSKMAQPLQEMLTLWQRARSQRVTIPVPQLSTLPGRDSPEYQEELREGKELLNEEIEYARNQIRQFSAANPYLASMYYKDDDYHSRYYSGDEVPVPHPDVLNAYINRQR